MKSSAVIKTKTVIADRSRLKHMMTVLVCLLMAVFSVHGVFIAMGMIRQIENAAVYGTAFSFYLASAMQIIPIGTAQLMNGRRYAALTVLLTVSDIVWFSLFSGNLSAARLLIAIVLASASLLAARWKKTLLTAVLPAAATLSACIALVLPGPTDAATVLSAIEITLLALFGGVSFCLDGMPRKKKA